MNLSAFHVLLLCTCACIAVSANADTRIETSTLVLTFNDRGSLVAAEACYPGCGQEGARRLELAEADGIVAFGQAGDGTWVQRRGLPKQGGDEVGQLHFTGPKGQSVSWLIPPSGYRIEARVSQTGALDMRAGPDFAAPPAAGFGGWLERVRYVAAGRNGFRQMGLQSAEPAVLSTDWAGFRNRFWAVMASGYQEDEVRFHTGAGNTEAALHRTSDLGEEQYVFYLGPVVREELIAVDEILDELLYAGLWFWLRWISFGLHFLLGWIHSMVPIWGAAIMLLSLAVHVLMLPLSRLAGRFQHQVDITEARLAPQLSRIRKEFRGEAQAAKIVDAYKSAGVHPFYSLKSLLGVAIVIPVFIGAFDMLAENFHLLNAPFLWIEDLSRPDGFARLPFKLPFFGAELNLLPFLMTALSIGASVLHRPPALDAELRRKRARNMWLLSLAFFALFYTFPAGMVLYWTTNNLISAGKSLWAREPLAAAT